MSVSTMPAPASESPAGDQKSGRGKLFKRIGVFVAIVGLGAAAWFFLLRSDPNAEPKPGEVLTLPNQQINLAQGHYLSVGIALQLVEGTSKLDGSKALDATIETFSNKPLSELALPEQREALKQQLTEELKVRYDDAVMEIYFTQFVTQ